MLQLLIRHFVPDHQNVTAPGVRRAYGTLMSRLGIGLNILMSALKLAAGLASGSIAVAADGVNNLSDAASSAITLIGFRLSGKAGDEEHPFGHGRMEYISGLIVSMVILLMGFELAKTSVTRIISPDKVVFDALTAAVLIASVLIKLYIYMSSRKIAALIASPSVKAMATDTLSDVFATLAVLISGVIARFTGANTDGWTGLIVSILVLRAGYCAARETINPLLGRLPDPELVRRIEEIVLSYDQISGIHDLIVHDYGPGRTIISLHAEVPGDGDLVALHEVIDSVERRLRTQLDCEAVIHMDPVQTGDETVAHTRAMIEKALATDIDSRITIHDFRMVPEGARTKVIFDAVIPCGLAASDEEIKAAVCQTVCGLDGRFVPIVTLDQNYALETGR